ncbi:MULTISPECIES: hypothetical protein [unclassified Schlesneria]|uniref:hypothetical protein n=1 Tax=Schlesneria TaxID=656899 RepID=UPI00359FCD36
MQPVVLICGILLASTLAFADDAPSTATAKPSSGRGKVWYLDPEKGSTPVNARDLKKGDGSKENPWGTWESVVNARLINGSNPSKGKIHAGDTIRLRTGNHGRIAIQGADYTATSMITVEADEGHKPVVTQFLGGAGIKNWTFRNIAFHCTDGELVKYFMIFRLSDASDVVIEKCSFRTAGDATKWKDKEWETMCPWYGLWVKGRNLRIAENHVFGVENCIAVDGDEIEIDNNHLEYFINDGIEHTASNLKITRNRITDLYDLKSNEFHHDGMQGWNFKKEPLSNVVIDSNYVAFSTGKYEAVPPISEAVFQGIVIFDGQFENVKVSNNFILVTAFHGVGLYGVHDCVIENNTVIYQGDASRAPCWIGVFSRRATEGASEPKNVLVKNNIAPTYNLFERGIEVENNFSFRVPPKPWDKSVQVVKPEKTFKKFNLEKADFDLDIREESPAAGKVKTTRVNPAGARQ